MATQRSKFLQWIDFRVRLTLIDGRMMVGTFLAFDKHMNVVLADADQYRIVKFKKTGVTKQIKRTLGLLIVRGQNVVSLTAQAPPSQTHKRTDDPTVKPGKATSIARPANIPSIPNANNIVPPTLNPPSLVPPTGPLPKFGLPPVLPPK